MKKNIKYPNIVYCKEDPRLYDDYIQPLDCMDLRKIWSSYIPRNEFGKPSFPCPGIEAFDYSNRENKGTGD